MLKVLKRVLAWLSERRLFDAHVGLAGVHLWAYLLYGNNVSFPKLRGRITLDVIFLAADVRWFKKPFSLFTIKVQVQDYEHFPPVGVKIKLFGVTIVDNEVEGWRKSDKDYQRYKAEGRRKAEEALATLKAAGLDEAGQQYADNEVYL
jgi:hypothetical protein